MRIFVIPKIKLVIGWSPKCGCSTIKKILCDKLNINVPKRTDIHEFIKTIINKQKFGIYYIEYFKKHCKFEKIKNFRKVLIIRNPFQRFISGIKQKSVDLSFKHDMENMTISDFIDLLKKNNFMKGKNGFIYHHFFPQSIPEKNVRVKFNIVIDLNNIKRLKKILKMDVSNVRENRTLYNKSNSINEKYHKFTLKMFADNFSKKYSNKVSNWLNDKNILDIYHLYRADFILAKDHNILYNHI
jgi:hypothetical protein